MTKYEPDQREAAEMAGKRALRQTKGSYMDISELGITDTSKHLVRDLLSGEQPVPKGTLFDDDIFVDTCRNQRRCDSMLYHLRRSG
jgi:hypothetical protein